MMCVILFLELERTAIRATCKVFNSQKLLVITINFYKYALHHVFEDVCKVNLEAWT